MDVSSSPEKVELLVVGGGPAGMAASLEALKYGINTVIADTGLELGGQLVKQTHKFFGSSKERAGTRGFVIAQILREQLMPYQKEGLLRVMLRSTVLGIYPKPEGLIVTILDSSGDKPRQKVISPRAVLIATGAQERMIPFPNNDLPGIYGAGGIQTLMNTYGVLPGRRALIVGAGNIGLILAYQLLQAGVEVIGILEAANRIGGWWVHAAKVRRYGVPILLRHTVSRAIGKETLEGAIVAEITPQGLRDRFEVECDIMALAVGLTPSAELLFQAKVDMKFSPYLGGWVPKRDGEMRTSHPAIWVAGDVAGIEEASTAMIEGMIAANSIAKFLKKADKEAYSRISELKEQLNYLRAADVSSRVREGLKEVTL